MMHGSNPHICFWLFLLQRKMKLLARQLKQLDRLVSSTRIVHDVARSLRLAPNLSLANPLSDAKRVRIQPFFGALEKWVQPLPIVQVGSRHLPFVVCCASLPAYTGRHQPPPIASCRNRPLAHSNLLRIRVFLTCWRHYRVYGTTQPARFLVLEHPVGLR